MSKELIAVVALLTGLAPAICLYIKASGHAEKHRRNMKALQETGSDT